MPVYFFILDTSGSMSTRSHPQFSFFDLAKNYIETFIKGRNRADSRMVVGRENDRYFLLTTQGKYPENVKVVSEKAGGIVVDELKKLTLPYGSAQIHQTILDAFRILHTNRAQTGIDGVGTGRAIQNTEQIMMIVLTDGSGINSIPIDFRLYFEPAFLGSEMTKEAFRWDQKLYTVVFRIPSSPYRPTPSQLANIDIDVPIIERVCGLTGGRSFAIVSLRQIQTSIDYILLQSNQHKVGVRFGCLPHLHFTAGNITNDEVQRVKRRFDSVNAKKPVTNLISRSNNQGRPVTCHWPIPESYFPTRGLDQLPQRTAHPVILCAPMALPLTIRSEIPVDKLELEPGGVTDLIMDLLQKKKDMTIWTFIEGSSNGPTAPFGCLRMNTFGTGVTLILLPFNFPQFYPLIEEVVKEPILTTSQVWRSKLDSYFQTVPYYYFTPMRNSLDKIKVKVDYSSSMSNIYAGQLLSNLNRLKVKAKEEYDKILIECKLNESKGTKLANPSIRIERITSRTSIIGLGGDDDDYEERMLNEVESTPIYAGDFKIPLYPPTVSDAQLDTSYRNPYIGSVEDIVSKLNRIQANVDMLFNPNKASLLDMARLGDRPRFNTLEELHNMPQKLMGEYEPYQAARLKFYGQPMRKIDEEKDRTHAFGNPYKLKGLGAGIDEVMDSAVVDGNSPNQPTKRFGELRQGGGPPKRRRGPLGIDAFDQYRTRRSIRGSSASSDISDFSVSSGDELLIDSREGTPGTSGSSTPSSEFENLQLEEMDTVEQLTRNLNDFEEMRGRDVNIPAVEPPTVAPAPPPPPPAEILTDQEVLTRKIRIGTIVRKPANHRAYDEIMILAGGNCQESILIRHALRESQRFKLKMLTEKLEERLKSIG
ncbi:hypothetical protein B9Z55_015473 [Caenorhabditis nigoni]|uniref:Integrator complex subunit 6-like beta-barrel domain-containing protein n=1 Tax=Caenorhabditis nigoni TaxID=1611254 RepID=A0A2G5UAD8_9PELO|nr:hypothetical protein B9Z55_015473 [Caenorhabditis nigoni]